MLRGSERAKQVWMKIAEGACEAVRPARVTLACTRPREVQCLTEAGRGGHGFLELCFQEHGRGPDLRSFRVEKCFHQRWATHDIQQTLCGTMRRDARVQRSLTRRATKGCPIAHRFPIPAVWHSNVQDRFKFQNFAVQRTNSTTYCIIRYEGKRSNANVGMIDHRPSMLLSGQNVHCFDHIPVCLS